MEKRLGFPVNVSVDEEGNFLVKFPDLDGTATDGKTRSEALLEAMDCLGAALAFRIKKNMPIPKPSPARGRPVIYPATLMAAKTALYLAWKETGMSCLGLAKKLGIELKTLQRMLDPRHRTHVGSIEAILASLGKRFVIEMTEAA